MTQTEMRIQGVRNFPVYNITTEPIHDGHKIHKSLAQPDICYICSPYLVRPLDHQAFQEIGQMVLDDLELILKGLPPVRMQQARLETVRRWRSRAVAKHE